MKEKVLMVIKKFGKNGIDLRDISYEVKASHSSLLKYIFELKNEGKIYDKTIGYGLEAYIKYYVKKV